MYYNYVVVALQGLVVQMAKFVWSMEVLLDGVGLRSVLTTAGGQSVMMNGMRVRQWWSADNSTSTMDKVSF